MSIANDTKNNLSLLNKPNIYCVGENSVDMSVENNSQTIICKHIKPNSKVLDVGCAAGILGKFLTQEFNCDVDGIDLDDDALDEAKKCGCYKNLYNLNVENFKDFNFLKSKNKKYNYIVFADILEHTYNPINLIYKFGEFLAKDGKILVSIPNFSHYDIVINLLNEKFNYSKTGILDNTHLRFFTETSFIDYILNSKRSEKMKFSIKKIGQTKLNNQELDVKYPNLVKCLEKNKNYNVFQNLFMLEKNKSENKKKKEKFVDYALKLDKILNEHNDYDFSIDKFKVKIENLNKENSNLNEELENIKKDFDLLKKENQILNTDIKKILQSKSWKITKPLRSIVRIFIGKNN